MSESTAIVVSVEDNPADTRLIKEGIRAVDSDVELRVYSNGQNAVDRLLGDGERSPARIDLLLLDINLPGKSGLEILRLLNGEPQYNGVPIVAVSSSKNPEDIQRVYEASANAFLSKPSDPDEFIQTIAAAVRFWIPSSTD